MDGNPILTIKNLTHKFGGVTAVDNVSISVARSSIHGILGPNGSGKTTTFNCVTGVLRVQQGEVSLEGNRLEKLHTHKISGMGIARTFQGGRLFKDMTIAENLFAAQAVHFKARQLARSQKEILEKQKKYLNMVGAHYDDINLVRSMPVKQQRLVEIARALACEPKVLLLDEPAAGMDPTETWDLSRVILRLRDSGITIILIEHDMKLAMGVCDYISVLSYGKLIAEGTPAEIQANPEVISAYLGVSGRVR